MIKSATFYTDKLKAMKRFYGNLLELDIVESTESMFTVRIGESELTFKHSDRPAFYHYAINIPGNQFSMMKYWVQDRVTFNREEGRDEVYFPSFDADSMYFEDPAGNVVELIGRRKRDLFGDLTKESFLNISEVGVVTPFVTEVGEQLQDLGIPLRNGTDVNPDDLNFLGRGDTYIVLVPPGRRWYFSKKGSETFPLELTWNGEQIQLDEEGKLLP
ncbi:glyoxalase [Sporosarcina oncorhynchi]|uniref:Glyoxalase n=1 Tax=Sporosarcina oncorhynchi TaxID=3056444 RepID=A0ABZ0L5J3_9BACL|nr:glyoxalase [Sporosarcina sp. T2O-4]WOV86584.1 glyoxalase [Sporosarcina sp. T2O-4]